MNLKSANATLSDADRERILKRDNYQCRFCGSDKNLDIHHRDGKSYSKKGSDSNNEDHNLITLCHQCHLKLHAQQKKPSQEVAKRNENILKYSQKGMSYRAIGNMFHLSHTQIMNILRDLKQEAV